MTAKSPSNTSATTKSTSPTMGPLNRAASAGHEPGEPPFTVPPMAASGRSNGITAGRSRRVHSRVPSVVSVKSPARR